MKNYKELLSQQLGNVPIRAFAFLVNGEFATAVYYPENSDMHQILMAALASDPKVVEITHLDSHPDPASGWTWNGTNFEPPVSGGTNG